MSVINKNDTSLTINPPLVMKAPKSNDITFFNEAPPPLAAAAAADLIADDTEETVYIKSDSETVPVPKKPKKIKKKVSFPENVIKDYSDPPRLGWIPGSYPTSDLVEAYMKSCEIHKCKSLGKLVQQLKALQDIDCSNGEKVNVLNLKNERIDSKQIETLEEIFKRLSFKTIDLEHTMLEDESCPQTLFEIIGYYDTAERLILTNLKNSINLAGWQELSKYIRKGSCLEYLDLRGHQFAELIFFTYLARSIKLTTTLRVVHLENSNVSGRYLLMLAAALKDNEQIKEVYLGDNKLQAADGNTIATIIKENKCLEVLDLRNNHLHDIGLSYICSGLSEQVNAYEGLRNLVVFNNSITAHGISYLSKALIHNRSLTTINVGHNSLTNEAIFELKEALIVNKQICSLFLNKTKLSDEGVIALAEYIAETTSLVRLDLRENDIKLGGLMALVSSLKFNNTLSRLDVDRETRREHFFHISFQLKDSVETSKRLLQDLNDYCMRNQRNQFALEAKRAEKAREQAEERRLLQLENERQLLELVKEINGQVAENNEPPADDKVDNLLNKVILNINNNLNSHNNEQSVPEIVIHDENDNEKTLKDQFGDVDQYNNSHFGSYKNIKTLKAQNESFHLIEGVEEESTETDSDMVIFRTGNEINDTDDEQSYHFNRLTTTNSMSFEPTQLDMDVLSVVNTLVERVILNMKQLEPESVHLIHQNSSTLSLSGNSSNDLTNFFNFNDSNDLSTSIEPVCSQLDEDLKAPLEESKYFTDNNSREKQLNDSSIVDEDESCNDSDIEVLAISSKLVNDVISTSVKMNKESTTVGKALLTSITEQQVNNLINMNDPANKHQETKEESETSKIISNYDVVSPDNQMLQSFPELDSSEASFSINTDNRPKSTPIKKEQKEHNSSSDTSLILSTSPFNQFSAKIYEQETNLSPTDSCSKKASSQSSSQSSLTNKDQPNFDLSESVTDDLNDTAIADKTDPSNRPFFASKMTNSQISEELLNEIAFERE